MKAKIRKISVLIASTALVACTNNDIAFDSDAYEKDVKKTYSENFVSKYSGVDLNQSWDYSSKQGSYSLPGSGAKATTRAGEGGFTKGDWYDVDFNTLSWMHERLREGNNNGALGKPFYMTVPGNNFTIVPIYQGVAGAKYELHVVVGGNDITVWAKSEDIQIKDNLNPEWHACTDVKGYFDWAPDGISWESMYNTDGSDKSGPDGNPQEVTAIRSKEYKFSGLSVGADMYFYLKITQGAGSEWNVTGAEQSSLNHMMIALTDVPRPANIDASKEVMIIGCEDSDREGSDWDYNDVVFLVYGEPNMPKPIEITEGEEIVETRSVRYMIEDLGATDDFDFNDIVLDVAEVTKKTPRYVNGVFKEWINQESYQKAYVRHLGGTLPFKLKIGNTQLEEMGGQSSFQTSPDLEFDVTGWDINAHNITIEVKQTANSTVYNTLKFPKAGEAPMVIAVDTTQGWMPERQSVPESWFYTTEEE